MKKRFLILIVCLIAPVTLSGCADMTPTQKGAAYGAGAGAIAGQLIGGNTGATLIGAGVGALGGALLNDHLESKK